MIEALIIYTKGTTFTPKAPELTYSISKAFAEAHAHLMAAIVGELIYLEKHYSFKSYLNTLLNKCEEIDKMTYEEKVKFYEELTSTLVELNSDEN